MKGKIIKGIAGFYYVNTDTGIYECKAKGIFRKDNLKPLVGDNVELEILDESEKKGNICQILPRNSQLIRPAVANVDQALVIFSIAKPQPNFNLLDRFLIMMQQQQIPCVICFNKLDLDQDGSAEKYSKIYKACGYPVILVSTRTQEGIGQIKEVLAGKTTTVAGPSGVGKSSLINSLGSGVVMETGDISHKIERGKHTTRHAELIPLGDLRVQACKQEISDAEKAHDVEVKTATEKQAAAEAYILDTPGFSSLDLFDLEKEELASYYPEFTEYEKYCRFGGCAHISEPDCGIKDALEEGHISRLRYENYCLLYEELKKKKKY